MLNKNTEKSSKENIPNISLDDLENGVLSPEEAETELGMRELPELKFTGTSEASEKHPDKNEDAYFINKEDGTAGVFDGLGGYGHGELASKIANESIELDLSEIPENIKLPELEKLMSDIIKKASNEIIKQSKENDFKQIGTTATVVKFWEGTDGSRKAVIANVGDSRVYRFRAGKLEAITQDDSIVQRLIDNKAIKDDNPKQTIKGQDIINTGLLSEDDAKNLDPNMNISIDNIRRMMGQALGVNENNNKNLKPNIKTIDIEEEDMLLLSSDGIHDNLTDEEIERLLKTGGDEKQLSESIVRRSALTALDTNNPRAKEDDKTLIIIKA